MKLISILTRQSTALRNEEIERGLMKPRRKAVVTQNTNTLIQTSRWTPALIYSSEERGNRARTDETTKKGGGYTEHTHTYSDQPLDTSHLNSLSSRTMRYTFKPDDCMVITIPLGSIKNAREGQLMPDKFTCRFKDSYKVFQQGRPKALGNRAPGFKLFVVIIVLYAFEFLLSAILIHWESKAVCRAHFNSLPMITLKQDM
ncbi:hypothetical protein C0J45_18090 [Silurus meridionalis]|nr:hypothetical protein C0J45_18090 [Silurus meridionalis]